MAFNSTLWRPDRNTVAAINRGNKKVRAAGLRLTEADVVKKAREAEADRRFGQPHYGHGEM